MRLRVHPMRPKDVKACVELHAAHPEQRRRYGALLEKLGSAWLKQIRSGGLTSSVLEDVDQDPPQIANRDIYLRYASRLDSRFLVQRALDEGRLKKTAVSKKSGRIFKSSPIRTATCPGADDQDPPPTFWMLMCQ